MSPTAAFTDQEQAHLAELAEMDMALARHAHAHALASDDPAVIAEMGRTYQRAARSARQSVALSAKLRRDTARDAAEAARLAERDALLRPWKNHPEPDDDIDDDAWAEGDEDDDRPAESSVAPIAPIVPEYEGDLRAAMRRLIWNERERLDAEETPDDLFALLEERLESRRRRPAPLEQTLDDQVADLCAALGLPADQAHAWRDLPDPEPSPEPSPDPTDPWRSSA